MSLARWRFESAYGSKRAKGEHVNSSEALSTVKTAIMQPWSYFVKITVSHLINFIWNLKILKIIFLENFRLAYEKK